VKIESLSVKGNAKVQYSIQRFLHETNSWPEAFWQSRKWQLIGMS